VDFWNIEGIVEHDLCSKVMVESLNHLTLHPTSILCIYKVFQHLYAVDGDMGAPLC
jgi:hypothetical protein